MRQVARFVFSVHLFLSFQCWTPALEWQFVACLIVSGVQMKDHFGKLSNLAGSPQWLSSFKTVNGWPCKNTHRSPSTMSQLAIAHHPNLRSNRVLYIYIIIFLYPILSPVYPWISPHSNGNNPVGSSPSCSSYGGSHPGPWRQLRRMRKAGPVPVPGAKFTRG